MPVRMAAAEPASTACSIAVSAPSSRISAQANGCSSGWPASGAGAHDQVSTVPVGPTSTSSAGGSAVTGSYSNGGACTRPSAARAAEDPALRQRGHELAQHRAQRPGVVEADLQRRTQRRIHASE